MNLLLFENVPLRTTRQLGDFSVDAPLAHRYGDLSAARFKLQRLTPVRFFVADHVFDVTKAFIDDEEALGWEASIERDSDGHAWTIVTFAAPVPADAVASAAGRGKRNALTGELLQNPAEIMEDVLRIAGRSDVFIDLRGECAEAAIVLAGSVDTIKSIRAQLDEIAYSAGAIWTPRASRLYPADPSDPIEDLESAVASGLSVRATVDDTADVLHVSYDREDATGKPQHYVELTASPQRFGGLSVERVLPWLRTPANAEAIGRRTLKRMAGERYLVTFGTTRTDLRPCTWIRLIDNPEWPFAGDDPVLMVLAVDVTPDTGRSTVSAETILATPSVRVTGHSVAVPGTTGPALDVIYSNGIATFRITDQDAKPLIGARVSLDGGAPRNTDDQGRVQFAAGPGRHKIAVEAAGYTPFELEILL